MNQCTTETPTLFITGGGVGMGRKISLTFAKKGYRVAVTGIEGNEETAREIRELGSDAIAVSLDLTDPPQVDAAVERVMNEWGRIDVLVNNSGIEGPTAPLVEVSPEEWHRTLAVNLTGAYLCDRAIAPHMMERRSGCILHISSLAGLIALSLRAPYVVSKAAMVALTPTLAAELGPYNIRVNAICPGPVEGDRIRNVIKHRSESTGRSLEDLEREYIDTSVLNRMVQPEDIANMAVFLASPEAKNITGQSIRVCGGQL